jgi:hypothetical protein
VRHVLPDLRFRVELDDGHEVLTTLVGNTMFGLSVRKWNASPETAKLASLRQTGFFRGNPFAHYSRELGMKCGSTGSGCSKETR